MGGTNACGSSCVTGCAECYGTTNATCTECSGVYFKWLSSNVCDTVCESGSYGSGNICIACDDNCLECDGASDTCT